MPLTAGQRFGSYEVIDILGAGGMGEVYRARDTKLNRHVALKVLPESFASDSDRLARFTREAQTLASLNHPNIAAIYGVEDNTEGVRALVMELVEGEDLSAVIAKGRPEAESGGSRLRDQQSSGQALGVGPQGKLGKDGGLPLDDALPIARQIADALEAAHEQGVIHRDLKPANVKLRADGTVKVLDFGLAKAIEPAGAGSISASMSPTLSMRATEAGLILGTAAYMAPEQAKGRAVDRRADVWAFGAVLFEMLTGKRAFAGDDISDTLVAVLRDDPDWSALPADVPASTRQVLRVCLQKDPKKRVRDMSAIRLALDGAFDAPVAPLETSPSPARVPRLRLALPWAAAAFIVGGLVVGFAAWIRPPATPRVARFVVPLLGDELFRPALTAGSLALAPDGSRLVYRFAPGNAELAVLHQRALGEQEPNVLAGTDGALGPFFSPDGQWIAFSSTVDSTLKRVSVSGGSAQTICVFEGTFRGGSWGPDDTIVFATSTSKGLRRVPAGGGQSTVLTTVNLANGETDHLWPEVLPDGSAVLFTAWNGAAERSRIVALSLPSGAITELVRGGTQPKALPSGHLVFSIESTLRAVRFDAKALKLIGNPIPILERVSTTTNGAANYAVAADGSLLYLSGPLGGVTGRRTLVWVDRRGRETPINVPPRAYTYARLSPDGKRVALDARDQQNDIWIWDLARETLHALTVDPGLNRMPVWSPDSLRVAFTAERDGNENIYSQRADRSGEMEHLSVGTQIQGPTGFSPDGKRLFFATPMNAPYDIGVIELDGTRRERMILQTPTISETNGIVSPDGRWLAYESNETKRSEIYVAPFPDVTTKRETVSTAGGTRPLWSPDGRELFYYVAPDTIMAVPVSPGPSLRLGKPVIAVKGTFAAAVNAGRNYDVHPDGRFLLLKDAPLPDGQKSEAPELRLVLNWTQELKGKVP